MKSVACIFKEKTTSLMELQSQLGAATSVSLGFFTGGLVRAWASPGVPSMQSDPDYALSYAPLSNELVSWISGLAPLGALCGGLSASIPLTHLGRKKTLLLGAVLFSIAFTSLGLSALHEVLAIILLSRALMGFGIGLSIPAVQIYISECTESSIRGALASLPAVFMALGALVAYVVGAFLPWPLLSYFCVAFPVLMLVTVMFLPESPVWLLTNDREGDARTALKWLRSGKEVENELSVIRENLERSQKQQQEHSGPSLAPLLRRPTLLPLFLSMSLMFFQQWCGVNAVIFYTVSIFAEVGSNIISNNLATIIVGIVQFVATFGSIFLVDKAGRRLLLTISGVLMCVSLAGVSVFFYLQSIDSHGGLELLPLVGLTLFMVGYSAGFASVPFVLMGELFPSRYRNLLGAISSGFNLAHTFLVIKLFTNLRTLLGMTGVFALYSVVSLIGAVFVLIFLPETKGKTLEEIEAYFRKEEQVE